MMVRNGLALVLLACAVSALAQGDPELGSTPATDVSVAAGRLYVGTPDGSVQVFDAVTAKWQETLKGAQAPVSLVAASPAGVAWIGGGQPAAIRDRAGVATAPSEQTLYVRPSGAAEPTVIVLRPAGVDSPVRKLAWIGDRLAVIEDFNTTFFDAKSKAIVLPDSFMPKATAQALVGSRLWAKTLADGTSIVVLAKPYGVRRNPLSTGSPYVTLFTTFRVKDGAWSQLGGFASNAFDLAPIDSVVADADGKILPGAQFQVVSETVAVDEQGVVGLEGTNLLTVPVAASNWESSRQPIAVRWSDGELPPDSLWFDASANSAWWWDGNALVQQDRKSGQSCAYLRWNEPEATIRGFAVDGDGVWIATTVGVRRLDPKRPDPLLGYGGLVRAPLGRDAAKAPESHRSLEQAIWKWRLAPANEAGQDGGKMIAAIFNAFGVSLPKEASAIGASKAGQAVHDELKFGDVLVFRRGAAIYIGDGKTVEVQKGFVRNATIWPRAYASVRRFAKP